MLFDNNYLAAACPLNLINARVVICQKILAICSTLICYILLGFSMPLLKSSFQFQISIPLLICSRVVNSFVVIKQLMFYRRCGLEGVSCITLFDIHNTKTFPGRSRTCKILLKQLTSAGVLPRECIYNFERAFSLI